MKKKLKKARVKKISVFAKKIGGFEFESAAIALGEVYDRAGGANLEIRSIYASFRVLRPFSSFPFSAMKGRLTSPCYAACCGLHYQARNFTKITVG